MKRIRKGDEVVVLAGRDKGKRGTVTAPHRRGPRGGRGREPREEAPAAEPDEGHHGGIVDKDLPIHISNVALFNPATKKADRVGVKTLQDGRKVRVFKANGEQVDA